MLLAVNLNLSGSHSGAVDCEQGYGWWLKRTEATSGARKVKLSGRLM